MYLLHRSVGPSVQFLYSGCMIAAKFRIMTIEQRAVRGTAENFVICDTQKSYSENLFRRLSEKLSGYFQFHVFPDSLFSVKIQEFSFYPFLKHKCLFCAFLKLP